MAHEYYCKIVLVGDAGVGKSCFLKKYVDDEYEEDRVVTIGVDNKSKVIDRKGELVKLSLWDTAGEERFRATSTSIYRGADGVILFYDICDRNTFKNTHKWKQDLDKMNPKLVYALVGTKCDLEESRSVSCEEGKKLAEQWGIPFFETSSKSGQGIDDVLSTFTNSLLEKSSPPCVGMPSATPWTRIKMMWFMIIDKKWTS